VTEGGKGNETEGGKEKIESDLEKRRKDPVFQQLLRDKSKEILWGYIMEFKCLMITGLMFNVLGMVGEFANPLFIGLVIDQIVKEDFDQVNFLTIVWMIVNTSGAIFGGIQRYIFQITTERIGQSMRYTLFE